MAEPIISYGVDDLNDLHAPYLRGAPHYLRAGWLAPIPVDVGAPGKVVTGYTGGKNAQRYPTSRAVAHELVTNWMRTHRVCNLGLWLPRNVIGIDVDAYDDKEGDKTLAMLENEVGGPLPHTWSSTARGAGNPSRIYLFRVADADAAHAWVSRASGIDIVRFGHRYARVWPSVKTDKSADVHGAEYRWYHPGGQLTERGVVPHVMELTQLPGAWVERFTRRSHGPTIGYGRALSADELDAWADGLHAGEPCGIVREILSRHERSLSDGLSRHDTTNGTIWALLSEGAQGHVGVNDAVDQLCDEFLSVVTRDRSRTHSSAVGEWSRMLIGAVERIASAYPTPGARCQCDVRQAWARRLVNGAASPLVARPGEIKKVGRVSIVDRRYAGGV